MHCILVDWSGGWATPWGSAAHRTLKDKKRLSQSHPIVLVGQPENISG